MIKRDDLYIVWKNNVLEKVVYIKKEIWILINIFLISVVCCFQSPLNIWNTAGVSDIDSSVFKTVALCMQNGLTPYKDIFDHKGPLIYIYNWLGNQISYYRGIWIIEFVSIFISFYFIYKISRIVCSKKKSIIVIFCSAAFFITFFDGGNLTEEYAIPFITLSLYIFCEFFLESKISKFRLILLGGSFGAILMLRANMITLWCVFCVLVLIKCIKDKCFNDILYYITWFLCGSLIIVLPIVIWLITNGAFYDFINDYFIFNLVYTNSATSINKMDSFFYFIQNSLILIPFALSIYFLVIKKDIFHVGYVVYFFVSLLSVAMSGRTYSHYGMILVPTIVYPIAKLIGLIDLKNPALFLVLIIFTHSIQIDTLLVSSTQTVISTYLNRNNYVERPENIDDIVLFIKNNTLTTDKITVYGSRNIFYVLSQRLPASRYSYLFPISDLDLKILQEYFLDLEVNKPQIIVLPKSTTNHIELIMEFIDENNYSKVQEFDSYIIYERME